MEDGNFYLVINIGDGSDLYPKDGREHTAHPDGFRFSDRKGNLTSFGELHIVGCEVFVFEGLHHTVHFGIRELKQKGGFDQAGFRSTVADRPGGSLAVGINQTACSQKSAPKIAHHYAQDIGEAVAGELSQDRFPCCGGGLTVIVGSETDLFLSESPGITVMAGVVMLSFDVLQDLTDFLFPGNRVQEGEKAASLVLEEAFGRGGDRDIGVAGQTGYILSFFSISST